MGTSNIFMFLPTLICAPVTKAVSPNTSKILAILEPTTLPSTMEDSSAMTAVIEVANSGSEVPNATIVIPTTKGEIPRDNPIFSAESIKKSDARNRTKRLTAKMMTY